MRKPFERPRNPSQAKAQAIVLKGQEPLSARNAYQDRVLSAYARWAPIYDFVFARLLLFGAIFDRGRKLAIAHINTRSGKVLEVGVGTGVALARYAPHLAVTGIDLSPDMLAIARRRTRRGHLSHVRALIEMDAGDLAFDNASFDTVALMYLITVVPHPARVLDEVARVLKPGGEAVIVSHFAASRGWRGRIERLLVPMTLWLGWRPDFSVSRVLGHPDLQHVETQRIGPFGVFSLVRLRKSPD